MTMIDILIFFIDHWNEVFYISYFIFSTILMNVFIFLKVKYTTEHLIFCLNQHIINNTVYLYNISHATVVEFGNDKFPRKVVRET